MKCCCSRPTLVIIIGVIYILSNIAAAIFSAYILANLEEAEVKFERDQTFLSITYGITLGVATLTVVLSALMVTGVVQKRYKLIAPFIWLCIVGMVIYVGVNLLTIGVLLWNGVNVAVTLILLVRIAFGVGLQTLILYPIWKLYKEWRAEAKGLPTTQPQMYAYQPTSPPAYYAVK